MDYAVEFGRKFTDALSARTGEPIVTDQDVAESQYALNAVWELVKYHGLSTWTTEDMPGIAFQVLVEASARLFMNLGGFVSERADGTQLERADEFAAGASLTPEEVKRLEDVAGKNAGKGALRTLGLVKTDAPVHRQHMRFRLGWGQLPTPRLFDGSPSPYAGVQTPVPYMPGDEEWLIPYNRPVRGEWW